MEAARRQEMPPQGGYKPIVFHRIPARQYFSGWALIGAYLGVTAAAAYVYILTRKRLLREEIEERSANFAVLPMLMAERDREYLKQLRRNRDEERELMKNVEGWEVGTWYGEPIYKLNTDDKLIEPTMQEYYIHAKWRELARKMNLTKMS